MGVILKNNAVSTITTAISASDVGLAVAAGTGTLFPTLGASDYFYATLVSAGGTYEVIKVTARVGDTMTIVRAQEGTTAQSFTSGSRIEVRVTAASIQDMLDYHDQASEISFTPTGGISSNNVQDAIAELDSEAAKSAALAASSGSSSLPKSRSIRSSRRCTSIAEASASCAAIAQPGAVTGSRSEPANSVIRSPAASGAPSSDAKA